MPSTYIPPKSRVGRLLRRADRLEAWSRAQAYLTGVQAPRRHPKTHRLPVGSSRRRTRRLR
jgi:hypothetical protein